MALKPIACNRMLKPLTNKSQPGFLNSKGQAALTDALYFLLIVSIICTMLFFYASNYGLTLQEKVSNQYWKEYATGALETILYSSTPRIAGHSLDSTPEVDYLLAAVKEDFAENGKIEETAEVLKQNIKGIMQPIAPGFDYMFYFYLFDAKEFAFVMLYTRDAPTLGDAGIEHGDAKIFFCNPPSLNTLEKLVEGIGASAPSNARVQFIEISESDIPGYPPAEVNLTMWIPTPLDSELLDELNCELNETIPSS